MRTGPESKTSGSGQVPPPSVGLTTQEVGNLGRRGYL